MTCIFCRIASGEVPARTLIENDAVLAFDDIAPQAPVHVLVIPRKHVTSLAALADEDAGLLGRLLLAVRDVARKKGVAESGFRTIANSGEHGGQEIAHLHFHVLGGRPIGRMVARG